MTSAPCALSHSIIFFEQVTPNLGDTGGGFEVGEVPLRETEVAVKAVDQNFEGVLQRMKITPLPLRPSVVAHVRTLPAGGKCAGR